MWTLEEDKLFWLLRDYSKLLDRIEYDGEYELDIERCNIHSKIARLLQCDPQSLSGVLHNFPREDNGIGYHIPEAMRLLHDLKDKGLLL